MREKRRNRGNKCRNWIARRESLGASECHFCELSSEDPQEYRKHKCRNWIARRESLGASERHFRELSSEDPQEYRKHMRMSVEKIDELLRLVESYISKTDTVMKAAIPARLKLEVTLRFLASVDSFSSLALYLEFHHAPFQDFYPKHRNQLSTHWIAL